MNEFINELIKQVILVIKRILQFIILMTVLGIGFMIIMCLINKYHKKINNVIEQDIELQKHNDSLKIEVNNLDSIKNAKVIEVKTLDNDSTIKLFYKLIK